MATAALRTAGPSLRTYNLMPLPPREEKRARGPPDGTGPDSRRKEPGPERTAGGQAGRIGRKAGEPQDQGGARPVRDDLQARQDAGMEKGPGGPL